MKTTAITPKPFMRSILLAVTCLCIIGLGVVGMSRLAASKKPPARKPMVEKKLSVKTIPAVKQPVSLAVSGYGQAEPVHIVEISPEVSGKVIEKHESLDTGGVIQEGDVLFQLDAADYKSAATKAEIKVELQKNRIEQLKVSYEKDQGRLFAVKKNTALAKTEYTRLKKLYEQDRVGTLSAVEAAEQSYNSLLDSEKNLLKSISLYPLQIAEAQSNLADAQADLKTARLNVRRCVVTAPFTSRVRSASIETGTYVTTGTPVVTLADDTILEIQVALSDKDAFENLGLRATGGTGSLTSNLKEIRCRVETVTGNVSADLPATLDRVVKYDSETRTLYVAVHVSQDDPGHGEATVPLMDGMFCKVHLKGKPVENAVKIPASAFNPDNTVYLARDERLKTLSVHKVMENSDHFYISGDFAPQDRIITSPLNNPVENIRLEISEMPSEIPIDQEWVEAKLATQKSVDRESLIHAADTGELL